MGLSGVRARNGVMVLPSPSDRSGPPVEVYVGSGPGGASLVWVDDSVTDVEPDELRDLLVPVCVEAMTACCRLSGAQAGELADLLRQGWGSVRWSGPAVADPVSGLAVRVTAEVGLDGVGRAVVETGSAVPGAEPGWRAASETFTCRASWDVLRRQAKALAVGRGRARLVLSESTAMVVGAGAARQVVQEKGAKSVEIDLTAPPQGANL